MGRPQRFDVLIAGGGLVGLALAPALARAGLTVAIADRAALVAGPEDETTWDARVYAISPGSARFLGDVGGWPPRRLEAVEAMRVEGDAGAMLEFSAYDLGERALAWIVEERALRSALLPGLAASGVQTLAPVTFAGLAFDAHGARLALADGSVVEASLLVGADGLRSWIREASGIVATPRPYGQTAVVANFACDVAHRGIARQWFLGADGILAWLPLPGRRISIVWSAPERLAAELMALAPDGLAVRVARAGREALGALAPLTPPAAFPLSFLRLPAPVAHRLALVGDAAHGVHPLAGQGVNLGFGDAEALARVLADRGPVADPGAPILLERYARLRAEPVLAMQTVTDGLAKLFGAPPRWLARLRNAGLAAVDRLPPVKRALAQPALR
ncbi:MAG TPA: FAD-dependent monooxygenase [Casimicrobiaceae bacterium]|nr:FAD-dependent monooxygenase [Casimicrobiaceae bacterium]